MMRQLAAGLIFPAPPHDTAASCAALLRTDLTIAAMVDGGTLPDERDWMVGS